MISKSIIIYMVFFITMSNSCSAYADIKIAMSKDSHICNAFYDQLFISPRVINKKRNYTRVEEIHWQPVMPKHQIIGNKEILNISSRKYFSEFDINNDGRNEFVLKWGVSIGGSLNESIYVFSKENENSIGVNHFTDAIRNAENYSDLADLTEFVINKSSRPYILTQINPTGSKKYKPLPAIYRNFDISAYWYSDGGISEKDIMGRYFIRISSVNNQAVYHKYHVIAKLDAAYQLHDVCYFEITDK